MKSLAALHEPARRRAGRPEPEPHGSRDQEHGGHERARQGAAGGHAGHRDGRSAPGDGRRGARFRPAHGRGSARRGCEGNVLLTYFDPQGRMRATAYDAAADSRNATFEQWLPDAARASPTFATAATKDAAKAVSLSASGWACEAWVQYPWPPGRWGGVRRERGGQRGPTPDCRSWCERAAGWG